MKPIAETPTVKRIPPKKLHPSNLLPVLPEGSTGLVVGSGAAEVVEGFSVVGFAVEVVL